MPHSTECFVGSHLFLVFLTWSAHFFLKLASLGKPNKLIPSLFVELQPAATHLLNHVWTYIGIPFLQNSAPVNFKMSCRLWSVRNRPSTIVDKESLYSPLCTRSFVVFRQRQVSCWYSFLLTKFFQNRLHTYSLIRDNEID